MAATLLLSWSVRRSVIDRVERGLVTQARLASELLSRQGPASPEQLDAEADALSRLGASRVTFITTDGRVIGDSDLTPGELQTIDNHANRPEVQQALAGEVGVARRYSATVRTDMLYVAVPVRSPQLPDLGVLRLALPLVELQDQLAVVWNVALAGLLVGLATALALSWLISAVLARRMRTIAETAQRYASGDFSRPANDPGDDEIAVVARVLDESVRELGLRAADRALIEAILGGMVEGVLVVNEYGRLQLVNAAARRMLKVVETPEDRHYLEIVRHPDIAAQIGYALNGHATEGRELQLPLAPGSTFVARSAPVASGATRGAVLVLHDITSLRRADQIRRDFVANVSHELRTPLTAVRGYVEALADGVDPEQSRRFLATITRHTLRMERLVRDLLRLARLDAGQELLERIPCRVDALLAGVETDLVEIIEERHLTVVRDIARDADVVTGDPAKLHDALRNLLENAVNYSPEGGTIRLITRRDGDRLTIAVIDQGPGIPQSDLSRVFERFYRVDKARAREGRDPGGTGLGLAIVRHLVELHGGRVSAANGRERGAVMTVELPA
ncbi:MAG: HAMP domain-containing protein [Acidobacteria bacterium]|nr:HAMP domain-containing protein [Acidobacteriota bacterium]